jgi:hypothetical protein
MKEETCTHRIGVILTFASVLATTAIAILLLWKSLGLFTI